MTSAIELDPKNSMAYQYLGFAHLKLRDIDSALASYSKAVEVGTSDWMAHKGLGVAYILKAVNNNDNALKAKGIEHWNTSLDINPDQPKLRRLLEKYSK